MNIFLFFSLWTAGSHHSSELEHTISQGPSSFWNSTSQVFSPPGFYRQDVPLRASTGQGLPLRASYRSGRSPPGFLPVRAFPSGLLTGQDLPLQASTGHGVPLRASYRSGPSPPGFLPVRASPSGLLPARVLTFLASTFRDSVFRAASSCAQRRW